MIHLIYGGSGSGKSEYAESQVLACSSPEERYYIATMMAYGEEGSRRVARHRALREGKGFQTIEIPVQIENTLQHIAKPAGATILVECVSNLVANEMFDSTQGEKDLVCRIDHGMELLASQVSNAIFVSNNVFDDGMDYEELSRRYAQYLGQINRRLAEMADQVTEVVAGIPIRIK